MNRRDRRRLKHSVGDLVNTSIGVLQERDPNYGLSVVCYVCGAPHFARGIARIEDFRSGTVAGVTDVPLCNQCLGVRDARDLFNRIIKQYWNAPDLKFSNGGYLTDEQLLALVERQKSSMQ